jgi:two-component system, sensor histidine kinase and response regulator
VSEQQDALINVLVVDDTPNNLVLLMSLLEKRGYTVRPAVNGMLALTSARSTPPDLILLDIMMPEMDGYEVCRQLKADPTTRNVPVIFLSALDETLDKVKAFEVGGVDYITKPFHTEEVIARVETQLELYRQRLEIEALREKERVHFEEMSQLKDQFVQMVSHDLKNPLSVIITYLSLLRRTSAINDEKAIEYLGVVEQSARQMNELITNLLDLAKIESGNPLTLEDVPLDKLILQGIDEAAFSAQEKGVKLVYTPAESDLTLQLDSQLMTQVISNLLSNAVKYTPSGGRVEARLQQTQDETIVVIKDDGLGIPADDLPYLFDRFYRVNSDKHLEAKGTGLGLSIVRAIVEAHNGRVWVESQFGVGTTFYVALPKHLFTYP